MCLLKEVKIMKILIGVLTVYLLFITQTGCKSHSTEPIPDQHSHDSTFITERKPNLYIYPKKEMNLTVTIAFPHGGKITESLPIYNEGWSFVIKPSGLIDNIYDYLFYECRVPDLTQKSFGWLISQKNLKQFFEENMSTSGFNEREIKDFTDYWVPILKDYSYYEIYPQYKSTLDKMSILQFSVTPDNLYRLQYVIIGRDNNDITLHAPQIEVANRIEFYAVEWGVVLK